MSDFDLESFLPYQLSVLSSLVSEGFARHYRDRFGLSVAEWRVLAHLSQQEAVSVREICRRVHMDKPKVSRAASRLEARGAVTKVENPNDRRLVELSLTDQGRAMMAELIPLAQEYEARIVALLGDDAEALRANVRRLSAALESGG